MKQLFGIVLILAIGLFVSNRWFGKLKMWGRSRFYYLTGEEFLLLGVVLGPYVTALIDRNTLLSLEPFVGLGLGYVGFVFGMQFRRDDLVRVPRTYYLATAAQNALVALVMIGALYLTFDYLKSGEEELLPLLLAAVATAIGTSTSFLFLVDQRTQLGRSELFRFMRFSSVFDDLFGVVLFGVAVCLMHPQGPLSDRGSAVQWLGVSVLVGIASGAMLLWAARMRLEAREELLILLGMVLFTGGLSTHLRVSPVFTNLVAGVFFCNLCQDSERYHSMLLKVEKPIYLFMLVVAGAMWQLAFSGLLALLVVYVVARTFGKVVGGLMGAGVLDAGRRRSSDFGLGLTAQSEMAVAMTVNLMLFQDDPTTRLVVSTVFVAIVINDLMSSFYFARNYRRT